jgi:DNA-binding MarR family transcriptional regulator
MEKSELVSDAVRLYREAHRAMRQPLFEGWKGLNLTVPQLRSLFFISSSGSSSPGRLAASLGVTPPNVTGIVDRLVEQGLVARRESEQDRRVLLLQTTDKGEAVLSDLRESRTNTMTDVLSRLHEAELQALVKGLGSLVKAAQERKRELAETGSQDLESAHTA